MSRIPYQIISDEFEMTLPPSEHAQAIGYVMSRKEKRLAPRMYAVRRTPPAGNAVRVPWKRRTILRRRSVTCEERLTGSTHQM